MPKPKVDILNVFRTPVPDSDTTVRYSFNVKVDGEFGVFSFIGDAGWEDLVAVTKAWQMLVADPNRLQGVLSAGGGGGGNGGGTLGGAESGGAGHGDTTTIKETQPEFTGDGVN